MEEGFHDGLFWNGIILKERTAAIYLLFLFAKQTEICPGLTPEVDIG